MGDIEKTRGIRDLRSGDIVKVLSPECRAVVMYARATAGFHLYRNGQAGNAFEVRVQIESGPLSGQCFTEHCSPESRIICYV